MERANEAGAAGFGFGCAAGNACASDENSPDDLRALGWTVAVHNDYRLNGDAHTFWLFTRGDQCIKGERCTDAEALNAARVAARRLQAAGDSAELLVVRFGEAAYRVGTTFAKGVTSSDDRKHQVHVAHDEAKAALLALLGVQPKPGLTDESDPAGSNAAAAPSQATAPAGTVKGEA